MSEYKNKVGELRSENEYQLRLKDMNYGEKIKEMKESYTEEMNALRTQYEVSQRCIFIASISTHKLLFTLLPESLW